MVTAVVAAGVVLVACGSMLLAVRRANARSERRLAEAMRHIDLHLETISASVAQALDSVRMSRPGASAFSLDFDELTESLVAETARRTRADAVILRVEGPRGRVVVTSIGADGDGESLDRSFAPPGERPFSTAIVEWTYPATADLDSAYGSALVLPVDAAGLRGALAAFARRGHGFRPDDAAAVRALLEEMAIPLANARRFAEVEARISSDTVTGALDRRGYELALGREASRARRAGRPLSVVVVALPAAEGTSTAGDLAELVQLVGEHARADDISGVRADREVAVLLPGTSAVGAEAFAKRIEATFERRLGGRARTLSVGLVELRPDEPPAAFEERIAGVLRPTGAAAISVVEDSRTASTAGSSTIHSAFSHRQERIGRGSADVLRADTLGAIAAELVETTRFGRSLALVVLDVGEIGPDADEEHDADSSRLSRVAGRIDRSVGVGSVHRLGASRFALVLPGSGVDEAEALVDALQSSLEHPYGDEDVRLSAGVTEAAESDDAESALGRAEHALWQARQAGPGTVVVAVPSRRPGPPA